MWLEEKADKWNTYRQDNVLWGKPITEMPTTVMAATEHDQRETRKVDTEGGGLVALIHTDPTQTGGPNKR
jgi:hypothetical protein